MSEASGLPIVRYRGEIMTPKALRKATDCWDCRKPIGKGEIAYSVFGNGMNRMRRLHVECVAKVIALKGTSHGQG